MAWLYLDYIIDFLRITPVRQVNKLGFLIRCSAASSKQNTSFQSSSFILILSNMCGAIEELMAVNTKPLKSWVPDSGQMAQTFGMASGES